MTSTIPTGTNTAPTPAQADDDYFWGGMADVVGWLDHHAGDDPHQRTLRILKIGEEFGEAISAWIGVQNQNPRKGVDADLDDVRSELCDVIIAASVALTTLTGDSAQARNELLSRTDEVLVRIAD